MASNYARACRPDLSNGVQVWTMKRDGNPPSLKTFHRWSDLDLCLLGDVRSVLRAEVWFLSETIHRLHTFVTDYFLISDNVTTYMSTSVFRTVAFQIKFRVYVDSSWAILHLNFSHQQHHRRPAKARKRPHEFHRNPQG